MNSIVVFAHQYPFATAIIMALAAIVAGACAVGLIRR